MRPEFHRAGPDSGVSLLVRKARAGDAEAFRALYEGHVGRVHALSLRLTADAGEAEDVTQEVFVAAWRRLNTYRETGQFSTWLHGITVRLWQQRLRSTLRRRAREVEYAAEYTEALRAAMPSADLELERAVAELPARTRAALVLHAIEGYSQAETADLMGVAEGTVKAHVHRARALLRERLDLNG